MFAEVGSSRCERSGLRWCWRPGLAFGETAGFGCGRGAGPTFTQGPGALVARPVSLGSTAGWAGGPLPSTDGVCGCAPGRGEVGFAGRGRATGAGGRGRATGTAGGATYRTGATLTGPAGRTGGGTGRGGPAEAYGRGAGGAITIADPNPGPSPTSPETGTAGTTPRNRLAALIAKAAADRTSPAVTAAGRRRSPRIIPTPVQAWSSPLLRQDRIAA